jgi:hypothetical protein
MDPMATINCLTKVHSTPPSVPVGETIENNHIQQNTNTTIPIIATTANIKNLIVIYAPLVDLQEKDL